ncbi:MAG: hypothetical protein PHY93_09915 [Bacteriovorax sp.]|nr:hypothetical protein [Bacteriovorax sp.]
MTALSILKDFVLESLDETKKRFDHYKKIYLGLLIVNILIRLPSSHLGYASSNILYHSSVGLILQVFLSVLMANLIITKVALDKNIPKTNLFNSSLRFIKGQVLYYSAAAIGFVLLVIPAILAMFFFCLTPILEILEDHKRLGSLKRSYYLVKKDIALVLIFSMIILFLYIVLELIFSRLRSTGFGMIIYFISASITTFISIIVTLSYVRLINYLKDLRVVGMMNEKDMLSTSLNSNLP